MYENFLFIYKILTDEGFDDSLYETLNILKFLKNDIFNDINIDGLNESNFNLYNFIKKRKEHIPIEYIFNKAYFMERSFHCSKDTLIPTFHTKIMVEKVIELINDNKRKIFKIIDMGTGCCNIALSIALECKNCKLYATDISEKAIKIAKKNVDKYNLNSRIFLFSGDMYEPFSNSEIKGEIDIIVCNPPYIPTDSIEHLPDEIKKYEPIIALDAGPYGLNFFNRLLNESSNFLIHKGILIFEIGEGQERLILRLIKNNNTFIFKDFIQYHSKPRFIICEKK